jgi:DNA-binding FadR family transcriptional regulator
MNPTAAAPPSTKAGQLASRVPRKRLHEFVVDELGSRIVRGELRPGEALPVEDDLANDFGVSRTVVREAIKVLAHKRLLKVRTRTGTRVSPGAEWSQLDQDILRWRFAGALDAKFVANVIELRRVIEPAAAELAAARATPAAVRIIHAELQQMLTTTNEKAHIAADLRFHLAILEATGNELLFGLRHGIEGALGFAIRLTAQTKEDADNSMALQKAVYDAIAARKPAVARAAMNRLVDRWADKSQRIVAATRRRSYRKTRT